MYESTILSHRRAETSVIAERSAPSSPPRARRARRHRRRRRRRSFGRAPRAATSVAATGPQLVRPVDYERVEIAVTAFFTLEFLLRLAVCSSLLGGGDGGGWVSGSGRWNPSAAAARARSASAASAHGGGGNGSDHHPDESGAADETSGGVPFPPLPLPESVRLHDPHPGARTSHIYDSGYDSAWLCDVPTLLSMTHAPRRRPPLDSCGSRTGWPR